MSTARWCAAAIAIFLVGACSRTPEAEENVRKALDEADIEEVEVYVDEEATVVHLAGTVETLADRTRAGEIAAATVGTTGRVINELTVQALEVPPDDPDEQLTSALDRLIDKDATLRERDVNVHVDDGRVTVTGEVRTAAEKERVSSLIKGAAGVIAIDNQLQLHTEH
jgi:hyperosmotically inducible protein